MVKNKTYFQSIIAKISFAVFRFAEIMLLLSLASSAVYLWKNPQIAQKWLNLEPKKEVQNNTPAELNNIKQQIENINFIIKSDNEKMNMFKQQFGYFDKSKADAEEIIKLNNHYNQLQSQISKLKQTSNSGALILTAAMIVRDNVSHGISCNREAEALKILAGNIDSINQDVDFVSSHCDINFMSINSMINKFNSIYNDVEQALKPKTEADWKKRLLTKINEYVTISTPKPQNEEPKFNQLAVLKQIKQLVDNTDLAAATNEMDKEENFPLFENEDVKNWYNQTQQQLKFYQSLSNIISGALVIMKVEDVSNSTEQY